MTLQVIVFLCLLAVAAAQYGGAPSYGHSAPEPYDPHPKYHFSYGVHDPHTHDIKNQHEERNDHSVRGSYELVEPDGTKRKVDYADNGNGFEAIVHREHNLHPSHSTHGYNAPSY